MDTPVAIAYIGVRRAAVVGAVCVLALLVGFLVYALDRQSGSAALLPAFFGHAPGAPSVFGLLGGSLPSFVHALAFTLLTAVILGTTQRARFIAGVSWLSIGLLFELGQHAVIKEHLGHVLPSVLGDYFRLGTFDYHDLLATAAGVFVAFALHFILFKRNNP